MFSALQHTLIFNIIRNTNQPKKPGFAHIVDMQILHIDYIYGFGKYGDQGGIRTPVRRVAVNRLTARPPGHLYIFSMLEPVRQPPLMKY